MLKIDNNFVSNKCPLCTSEVIEKVGDVEYSVPIYFSTQEISICSKPELWKCLNCQSRFIQKAIPEQVATLLYTQGSSNKRWSSPKFEASKGKEVIDILSKLFYKDIKILDIGCNTGELLDFAKAKGCQTYAIEHSLTCISLLKQKEHIVLSNLSETDTQYDIITAFDLVEHLYNLPEFIKSCHSQLVENGYLVILTGDVSSVSSVLTKSNWWYVRFPEHIVFPSKKFFKVYSKFKIQSWTYTYASRNYKHSLVSIVKQVFKNLFSNTCYNGLPSIGKDHVLIVLKK